MKKTLLLVALALICGNVFAQKANVSKAVSAVLKEKPSASLEEIIKHALKRL